MWRSIDVDSVVRPLPPDAPAAAVRRQQLDTNLLVAQIVTDLRDRVNARNEAKARVTPDSTPRFDAAELERELGALQERLRLCRSNLATSNRNPDGRLRFLQMGEKRADALIGALETLRQG